MKEAKFYYMRYTPLEKALPLLMAKIYERQKRCVLKTNDKTDTQLYDQKLWSYTPVSFLAHGCHGFDPNGENPDAHPIWITHQDDFPSHREVFVMLPGVCYQDSYDLFETLIIPFHHEKEWAHSLYSFLKDKSDQPIINLWEQKESQWEQKKDWSSLS